MIKSKRLKNFCQVCRKQCKDQNGYHCHLNSAHHQKRLRELATNPQEHIQKYSNQLQNKIVQILKTKYPGQAKDLQSIYEQYAQEKHHVKFNFTKWRDLAEFADHLRTNVKNINVVGKLPYCNVTYVVSKSTDFIKKKKQQQAFMRRQKQKQMSEKRLQQRIARMREMEAERYKQYKMKNDNKEQQEQQEVDIQNGQIRIDFNQKTYQPSKFFTSFPEKQVQNKNQQKVIRESNVEKLLNQIEQKDSNLQSKKNKKNNKQQSMPAEDQFEWITPGIIVKIKPHQIPQVFHSKKTAILQVRQPYVATVKVGNANLDIDQTYLQTVIPKTGHQVKLLRGQNRNRNGILKEVDIENGFGMIQIQVSINGQSKKSTIKVPFNQFSKVE